LSVWYGPSYSSSAYFFNETAEFADADWRDAPLGAFEQVVHIHTADYVENVQALSSQEGYRALDAGTNHVARYAESSDALRRCGVHRG